MMERGRSVMEKVLGNEDLLARILSFSFVERRKTTSGTEAEDGSVAGGGQTSFLSLEASWSIYCLTKGNLSAEQWAEVHELAERAFHDRARERFLKPGVERHFLKCGLIYCDCGELAALTWAHRLSVLRKEEVLCDSQTQFGNQLSDSVSERRSSNGVSTSPDEDELFMGVVDRKCAAKMRLVNRLWNRVAKRMVHEYEDRANELRLAWISWRMNSRLDARSKLNYRQSRLLFEASEYLLHDTPEDYREEIPSHFRTHLPLKWKDGVLDEPARVSAWLKDYLKLLVSMLDAGAFFNYYYPCAQSFMSNPMTIEIICSAVSLPPELEDEILDGELDPFTGQPCIAFDREWKSRAVSVKSKAAIGAFRAVICSRDVAVRYVKLYGRFQSWDRMIDRRGRLSCLYVNNFMEDQSHCFWSQRDLCRCGYWQFMYDLCLHPKSEEIANELLERLALKLFVAKCQNCTKMHDVSGFIFMWRDKLRALATLGCVGTPAAERAAMKTAFRSHEVLFLNARYCRVFRARLVRSEEHLGDLCRRKNRSVINLLIRFEPHTMRRHVPMMLELLRSKEVRGCKERLLENVSRFAAVQQKK